MSLFTNPKHSLIFTSLPFHYHSRNNDSSRQPNIPPAGPTLTVILPFGTVHAFALVSQYDKSFFLNLNEIAAAAPALMLTFFKPLSCLAGLDGAVEGSPVCSCATSAQVADPEFVVEL